MCQFCRLIKEPVCRQKYPQARQSLGTVSAGLNQASSLCNFTTLPMMIRQGEGRIVNVIGSAARQANPNYLVGGAANAALVHFTKGLSEVAAKDGIFVKAASPGAVQTERW